MKKRLPHLAVFAVVAAAYLTGGLAPVEFALMDWRFSLLQRPATGNLVVVEIDSRSLRELDVWPWPRRYHGALVDRLFAAGVRGVAFDIDFSSHSNPDDDGRFEQSLARHSGRVVMPVFKQYVDRDDDVPEIVHTAPIPAFRRHVQLTSVNVRPEPDGQVRRYTIATDGEAGRVPSMAALLAGRTDNAGGLFLIDFGIRPETVPRLSYVDVVRGNFDPDVVAGRVVMVGGTAVELGDNHAVPVHTVMAGPMLRALAYESLVQGRPIVRSAPLPAVLVALLLAWFLGPRLSAGSWRSGLAVLGLCGSTAAGLSLAVQSAAPVSLDIVPYLLVPGGSYLMGQLMKIDQLALSIFHHRVSGLQRQAMMKCVVNDSFDGIIITDQGGNIELVNPAACDMLGYDVEDMSGQHIDAFIAPPAGLDELYSGDSDGSRDSVKVNMIGPIEGTVARRDGTPLIGEFVISRSRLSIGEGVSRRKRVDQDVLIYTFRDIAARKQAEEALIDAKTQAELANRSKTEFLANMSHELRTPLNAVIGFSEIIKNAALGTDGVEQYQVFATDIHDSGRHLLALINDILDVSKIEAGELTPVESTFDLKEVIAASMRLIEERAEKAAVTVAVEPPPQLPLLRADQRMVRQILLNLLSNAVKFTPEEGKVAVRAAVDADGGVVLSVTDTGIGIAAEDLPTALAPFGQIDGSLARNYEGSGLGLPLVKAIAEMHGAAFTLDSTPGQGTTAEIRFPAERSVRRDESEGDGADAEGARYQIA